MTTPLQLDFRCVDEPNLGEQWRALFDEYWPAYRKWYFQHDDHGAGRPDYATCRRELQAHLPTLLDLHTRQSELVGGDDESSRFLSLYAPPPSIRGCTQLVFDHDGEPALLRNYDFSPTLCDGVLLHSNWSGLPVIAMTDCLAGALDGMNKAGLAVSLAFGGDPAVHPGFAPTLLVRAILEHATTTAEALALVRDVPVHMAYTLTLVDASANHSTIYLRPGAPAHATDSPIATNHQGAIRWPKYARFSATEERFAEASKALAASTQGARAEQLIDACLTPPIYRTLWPRSSGTLYTVLYLPRSGNLELIWPGARLSTSFDSFTATTTIRTYQQAN